MLKVKIVKDLEVKLFTIDISSGNRPTKQMLLMVSSVIFYLKKKTKYLVLSNSENLNFNTARAEYR